MFFYCLVVCRFSNVYNNDVGYSWSTWTHRQVFPQLNGPIRVELDHRRRDHVNEVRVDIKPVTFLFYIEGWEKHLTESLL